MTEKAGQIVCYVIQCSCVNASVILLVFYCWFPFLLFQLCFAYKGFLQQYIGVRYTLRQASDDETVTKTSYFSHDFRTDSDDEYVYLSVTFQKIEQKMVT